MSKRQRGNSFPRRVKDSRKQNRDKTRGCHKDAGKLVKRGIRKLPFLQISTLVTLLAFLNQVIILPIPSYLTK